MYVMFLCLGNVRECEGLYLLGMLLAKLLNLSYCNAITIAASKSSNAKLIFLILALSRTFDVVILAGQL